jgi:hypothetical protein
MNHAEIYEFRIQCKLDSHWSDWFDGLTVTNLESGEAILSGLIVDQAALHGVLMKIRDLGLPLIEVKRVQSGKKPPK